MNLENRTLQVGDYRATITISRWGRMIISQPAAEMMELQEDDRMSLFQDADSPTDWYIKKTKVGLKMKKIERGESLKTNKKEVALEVIDSLPVCAAEMRKSYRFAIATEPVEDGYYAIITRRYV